MPLNGQFGFLKIMTSIQKTKCPHCGSLFQVSEQQLQIANGTVRCGNCSNIFQAEEHVVDSKQTLISSASLYEQSSLNRDIEEVDESWALELLKELEAEEAASNPATAVSQQNKTSSPEAPKPAPELPVLQNSPADKEKHTETFSEAFRNLASHSDQEHFGVYDTPAPVETPQVDDESWTKEILKESSAPFIQENPSPANTPEVRKPNLDINAFGIGEELTAFRENSLRKGSNTAAKDYVSNLEIEPISLDLDTGRTRKFLHLLSSFMLVLLAALTLGLQYLSYNMETLAKNTQFRSYYSQACNIIGCSLPLMSDISAIRGKNLVVRTHPDQTDALRVDLIITNYADFPQDFPLLELTFSDANGFPVAHRRFKPAEYLSGALRQLDRLPAKTPLHISLDIRDPGKDAANYYVAFHENPFKKPVY